MRYFIAFLFLVVLSLGGSTVYAQQGSDDEGEVIMVEQEILIQVAPELPTVIVAIPRQKPQIEPVTLQSPITRMIRPETELIKPDLSQMKVSRIEQPEKMLAKER